MAPAKRIDIECKGRLQGAILCKADLKGYSQQHVDHVGLILVALKRQQHPLPP